MNKNFLNCFFNRKIRVLILVSVFLAFSKCGPNSLENLDFVKAQNDSNSQNDVIKNLNEDEFKLNGFDLKVLKKGDYYKLYYTHKKTNAQFVFDLSEGFEQYSSVFFGCPPEDDKGKTHALEHLLASVVSKKLLNKYSRITSKHFNGNTNEYGFWFLINNALFDFDLLEYLLEELKNPEFLKDNEETFKREIHSKYEDSSKAGRMYHEMLNKETEKDFKKIDFKNLKDIRFYDSGGKSKEILKINFKEMEEYFKKYIHPSNMLVSCSCLKDSKKIKEVLEFFEKNYLNNYSKKTINLNYNLRNDNQLFKFLQWDEKSDIFKAIDSKEYGYSARVCLNCKNFSLSEKNSLNIAPGTLYSLVKEEIEKMGYSCVEVESDDVLKDMFIIRFYGNDKTKFYENVLKESSKHILKFTAEFLEEAKDLPQNKEAICSFNNVLNGNYYKSTSFNRPDKYRKIYNMYNVNFLSFVKYNTPFSDKIFKIQNNEIVDDLENEKQNFNDYFISSLKKLLDSDFLFIDSFEKVKTNSTVSKNSTDKKVKFKINKYKNKDVFRFTEYILFKNILNNKLDEFGLSYKNLKNSPYVGAYPILKENVSSFESVSRFFETDFKKLIKNFNFSEMFFKTELRNYLNRIEEDILELERNLKILKHYKDFIEENKDKKNIVFAKQKIVDDLYKKIKDFKILFDEKTEYDDYKKNKEKYKKKYEEYLQNNLNSDEDNSIFFKEFEEYVNYETKLFEKALENLKEKLQNFSKLNYSDVKESIESVTYFKN